MHLAKQPSKPLKQKTLTDFFKPISDKDCNSINELNVLHITVGRLEQRKALTPKSGKFEATAQFAKATGREHNPATSK